MTCELAAPSLSALVDGELAPDEQTEVFAHLQSCPACRAFLADSLRTRGVLRRDRDALAIEADAVLPARAPRPRSGWRAPSPALAYATFAIGLAALLVAAGILIGAARPAREGAPPREAHEASAPAGEGENVVYVCTMPEFRVVSTPLPDAPR